ncbi:MAG: Gfo/Idh/MocA family oxidoreductase [Candidatus Binatia bacterium]|nr:Gfo/Idh/MocA family oxidoreductase [Candidatus Binatia bacterium]
MSERSHRVALVGAGRIAAVHHGYAKNVPNAQVVAVCDADRDTAEEFAQQRNIPAFYDDIEEMLRKEQPNIVHIVTPPATHARLAVAAMENGANVLVEKPMAMSVEDCDQMIETAERYGRRICVDHNRLFDPVILKARNLVDSGALGEIVSVEALQGVNPVDGGPAPTGDAHWSVADPFAPLYNLGPHPLYLAAHFLGPVDGVQIVGQPIGADGLLREIRVLLESNGTYGYVTFSMGAQPYLNHVNVFGTKGTLRANLNTMAMTVEKVRKLPKMVAKFTSNLEPAAQLVGSTVETVLAVALRRMKTYPGIGQNIRRFYKSLDQGDPAPVDGAAGRQNVWLLREIENHFSTVARAETGTGHITNGEDSWNS